MNVFKILFAWLIVWMLFVPSSITKAQDAREIITKMHETTRGESSYAEMSMTIERPRYSRDVSIRSWSLGEDFSLIQITAPARDEGTSFLKRGNEIWNFVPTVDRTIKMPPSMMSQSWMGSDFTNDDLVRESSIIEDYEHTLLRTEEVNGRQAYVIQMIPNPDTPIVWGKVLVWVDRQDYFQHRVENYDQRNELASTMIFDDIQELGGRILPARITMIPANRENQRTIIRYQNMRFDIGISQSFFTQQNMRRRH